MLQYECVVSEKVDRVRTYDLDAMQLRLRASVNGIETKSRQSAQVDVADVPAAKTLVSTERHTSVTPKDLSKRWGIRLQQAKEKLKMTTQKIVRSDTMPLGRRYRADRNFDKPRLRGDWSTDTLDGRVVSKAGNRYGQVFANKSYFAAIYPMDSKGKAGEALRIFCQEFGVPYKLTFDGSQEHNGKRTEFMHQIRKNDIEYHVIDPERHNENPDEGVIRKVQRKWYHTMMATTGI